MTLDASASQSANSQAVGTQPSTTRARFSSTTATAQFRTGASLGIASPGITVNTSATPAKVTVTIGDSDGTYTQILSGLKVGDLVITKTVAAGSASQAAPSILSNFGGNRTTGNRTVTGGSAGVRSAAPVRIGG